MQRASESCSESPHVDPHFANPLLLLAQQAKIELGLDPETSYRDALEAAREAALGESGAEWDGGMAGGVGHGYDGYDGTGFSSEDESDDGM